MHREQQNINTGGGESNWAGGSASNENKIKDKILIKKKISYIIYVKLKICIYSAQREMLKDRHLVVISVL